MAAPAVWLEPVSQPDPGGDGLAAVLADDLESGFDQLVVAYQDRLIAFVARSLGDRGRAEEVVQDVFVRAYRALAGYDRARRRELRVRPWLYAISVNLTRNAVRGRQLSLVPLEYEDGAVRSIAADRAPTPEAQAVQADDWKRVAAAIAALSPRIRPAFVLRYIEELSYDEIAEALAQPVGTVKASAHRGLMAVRDALESDR